jgi:hypothetical protein
MNRTDRDRRPSGRGGCQTRDEVDEIRHELVKLRGYPDDGDEDGRYALLSTTLSMLLHYHECIPVVYYRLVLNIRGHEFARTPVPADTLAGAKNKMGFQLAEVERWASRIEMNIGEGGVDEWVTI